MSQPQQKYTSPVGMWSAAKAKAISQAKQTGRPVDRILQEFVMRCLLARIAHHEPHDWVVKGGTAMLMRIPNARATRDIDLYARESSLEFAIEALRTALRTDLGDFFRFDIASVQPIQGGKVQSNVAGAAISINVHHGVKEHSSIAIDLVTGSLMTAVPDNHTPPPLLAGVGVQTVRLYPVVDHIADKVCATQANYNGVRSGRQRDLVDVILFALTHRVDGAALQKAIRMEWAHRSLQGPPTFDPPLAWRQGYTQQAKTVGSGVSLPSFDDALILAQAFIKPTLGQVPVLFTWDPELEKWL